MSTADDALIFRFTCLTPLTSGLRVLAHDLPLLPRPLPRRCVADVADLPKGRTFLDIDRFTAPQRTAAAAYTTLLLEGLKRASQEHPLRGTA